VLEIRIPTPADEVSASLHGEGGTTVVLGHGAGGDRRSGLLLRTAEALAGSGRRALLYNFPYSDRRRRIPDPPAVLEQATRAVGEYALGPLGAAKIVHGGKSMGGRIASQVVAAGARADALVFLGYPLHPPGRPDVLRDRHLDLVAVPMLFVQGTRDAFARFDRLSPVLDRLGDRATLHAVQGGDHSFAVPKGAGRSREDVEAELFRVMLSWLSAQRL
jgi:hypothetical protein